MEKVNTVALLFGLDKVTEEISMPQEAAEKDSRDRLASKETEKANGVTQKSLDTCPQVLVFTTSAMSVLL